MKSLLIATTNSAKFEEASSVLQISDITIVGLKDFLGIVPVEETGDTFEENAVFKAKGYFSQTKVPCIADARRRARSFIGPVYSEVNIQIFFFSEIGILRK